MKIATRKPKINDIFQILDVINDGKEMLKAQGNGQWQNGYPEATDLINDINNNRLYIALIDGKIVGLFAYVLNDQDYINLSKLKWEGNSNFLVMHRVCVKKEYLKKGIGTHLFEAFENIAKQKRISSIRIDTHEHNEPMTCLIKKMGYKKIGKAILPENKERIFYEKLI